ISQISAASSQASYPPANTDDQTAYNNDNNNFMGYETNPAATYAYSPDMYGNMEVNDVNDQSTIDMSRRSRVFPSQGQPMAIEGEGFDSDKDKSVRCLNI
ncbi:jg505, partial [Pararge aegeria aegeria]